MSPFFRKLPFSSIVPREVTDVNVEVEGKKRGGRGVGVGYEYSYYESSDGSLKERKKEGGGGENLPRRE